MIKEISMTSRVVVPARVLVERRRQKQGATGPAHVHTAHLGADAPKRSYYLDMLEAEANLVDFDNLAAFPEETFRDPAS
jgi:hypothetical protein